MSGSSTDRPSAPRGTAACGAKPTAQPCPWPPSSPPSSSQPSPAQPSPALCDGFSLMIRALARAARRPTQAWQRCGFSVAAGGETGAPVTPALPVAAAAVPEVRWPRLCCLAPAWSPPLPPLMPCMLSLELGLTAVPPLPPPANSPASLNPPSPPAGPGCVSRAK